MHVKLVLLKQKPVSTECNIISHFIKKNVICFIWDRYMWSILVKKQLAQFKVVENW